MDALWDAILRFLRHRHVAGATVLRPVAGFGVHELIHSPDQEATSEHMPMRIEFIDTAEKVDELLPTLYEMVVDGLIEVQDTNVLKAVDKGRKPPPHSPHAEIAGPAKMIRIYLGEADQAKDEPLFEAIVKRLMMMEVAGATVYRGILGYGAKRHTHRESRFRLSKDRPIMISVVDQPARVDEIIGAIAPMMLDGLIVISDVEVHRFVHALLEQKVTNASSTAS
jgi:PII-like signaling protein